MEARPWKGFKKRSSSRLLTDQKKSFDRLVVWPTRCFVNLPFGRPLAWSTSSLVNLLCFVQSLLGHLAVKSTSYFGQIAIWPTCHLVNLLFGKLAVWSTSTLVNLLLGRHTTHYVVNLLFLELAPGRNNCSLASRPPESRHFLFASRVSNLCLYKQGC